MSLNSFSGEVYISVFNSIHHHHHKSVLCTKNNEKKPIDSVEPNPVIASDAERSEDWLAVESLLLRSHMVTRNNGYIA